MHLAYLDDSGSRRNATFQVMAAVIVEGREFSDLEITMGMIVEAIIPADKVEKFEEFHAWQLFEGKEVFDGIEERIRFNVARSLLSIVTTHKIPIVYGAVDRSKMDRTNFGSADSLDVCFRVCMRGIEEWANGIAAKEIIDFSETPLPILPLVVPVSDDFQGDKKKTLRASFRQLRQQFRAPNWNTGVWHIHDDLYFGSSKDSVGLQLADLCAYIIRKHLEGDSSLAEFYQSIEQFIAYRKIEPQ